MFKLERSIGVSPRAMAGLAPSGGRQLQAQAHSGTGKLGTRLGWCKIRLGRGSGHRPLFPSFKLNLYVLLVLFFSFLISLSIFKFYFSNLTCLKIWVWLQQYKTSSMIHNSIFIYLLFDYFNSHDWVCTKKRKSNNFSSFSLCFHDIKILLINSQCH